MDRLTAMRHFLTVVENGNFSSAARRLGLANATVTQSVKNLESSLGVRLINRTTRHMTLTSEGSTYAERCRYLVAELDRLDAEVAESSKEVSGDLRVEIPASIGQTFIVPRIREFTQKYPDVDLTIFMDPDASTLTERGIDVAIQLGSLESSSLIAKRVYTTKKLVVASPVYRASEGLLQHPNELPGRECLLFYSPRSAKPPKWIFVKGDEQVEIAPQGKIRINSSKALIDIALEGAGVVFALDTLVVEHLKSGALVEMLPGWRSPERGLYIVYQNKENLPRKVRAFVRFIERVFEDIG